MPDKPPATDAPAQGPELWVVSNAPPPAHGVAIYTREFLSELTRRGRTFRFYRVGSDTSLTALGSWSLSKLLRDAIPLARFMFAAISSVWNRSRRVLYFTPSAVGFGIYRDVLVTAVGRLCFSTIVGHVHGFGWLSPAGTSLQQRLRNHVLKQCDKLICLGALHASLLGLIVARPCIGINNGLRDLGHNRKDAPSPGGRVELIFLSNLIRSKGLWIAAEASRLARSNGLDVRLTCAGSWTRSEDEASFHSDYGEELQTGTIVLVGHVDEDRKRELLARAHFLLLPTSYPLEGQPLVIVEALRAGVVPLVTDHAGIPDQLRFPEARDFCDANNIAPEHLATKIRRLSEPAPYERASTACRAHFISELTLEHATSQLLAAIGSR